MLKVVESEARVDHYCVLCDPTELTESVLTIITEASLLKKEPKEAAEEKNG